ncbi:hypothetical protein ACQ4M3_26690 [Leptolyngbya sp. AN03gr2]
MSDFSVSAIASSFQNCDRAYFRACARNAIAVALPGAIALTIHSASEPQLEEKTAIVIVVL